MPMQGFKKTDVSRKKPLRRNGLTDWFDSIKIGVPETAMLGWEQALTDSDIWKVAAYCANLYQAQKA